MKLILNITKASGQDVEFQIVEQSGFLPKEEYRYGGVVFRSVSCPEVCREPDRIKFFVWSGSSEADYRVMKVPIGVFARILAATVQLNNAEADGGDEVNLTPRDVCDNLFLLREIK